MNSVEVIQTVLDRLTGAGAGAAMFNADEVVQWPLGSIDALTNAELLKQAPPAKAVECDGCEENCIVDVQVITAQDAKKARAFIACDKRDDIGRVAVELARLDRWHSSGERLSMAISKLLVLEMPPKADTGGQRWKLGPFKAHKNRPHLTLNIDEGVTLVIAGHTLALADVLSLHDGRLVIDNAELVRLADMPAPPSYQPSIDRRELRKLQTQEMHNRWRQTYRDLKTKRPDMSDVWYSRQIAKKDFAHGRTAETIRKNMKR
jgi:hypothetical protein